MEYYKPNLKASEIVFSVPDVKTFQPYNKPCNNFLVCHPDRLPAAMANGSNLQGLPFLIKPTETNQASNPVFANVNFTPKGHTSTSGVQFSNSKPANSECSVMIKSKRPVSAVSEDNFHLQKTYLVEDGSKIASDSLKLVHLIPNASSTNVSHFQSTPKRAKISADHIVSTSCNFLGNASQIRPLEPLPPQVKDSPLQSSLNQTTITHNTNKICGASCDNRDSKHTLPVTKFDGSLPLPQPSPSADSMKTSFKASDILVNNVNFSEQPEKVASPCDHLFAGKGRDIFASFGQKLTTNLKDLKNVNNDQLQSSINSGDTFVMLKKSLPSQRIVASPARNRLSECFSESSDLQPDQMDDSAEESREFEVQDNDSCVSSPKAFVNFQIPQPCKKLVSGVSASSSDDERMTGDYNVDDLVESLSSPMSVEPPHPSSSVKPTCLLSPRECVSLNNSMLISTPATKASIYVKSSEKLSPVKEHYLPNQMITRRYSQEKGDSCDGFYKNIPLINSTSQTLPPHESRFNSLLTRQDNSRHELFDPQSENLSHSTTSLKRKDNILSTAKVSQIEPPPVNDAPQLGEMKVGTGYLDIGAPSESDLQSLSFNMSIDNLQDDVFEDPIEHSDSFQVPSKGEPPFSAFEGDQSILDKMEPSFTESIDLGDSFDQSIEQTPTKTKKKDGKKKGGRKSKKAKTSNMKKKMNLNEHIPNYKDVMCGKCDDGLIYSTGMEFLEHINRAHNGLARPKGESQDFTLTEKIKAYKTSLMFGVKLKCENKCNDDLDFKSPAGLLGHLGWCGKELKDRVKICSKCGWTGTMFTIKTHARVCGSEVVAPPIEEELSTSRPVRKSRANFQKKIMETLCNDDDDELENIPDDDDDKDKPYIQPVGEEEDDEELDEDFGDEKGTLKFSQSFQPIRNDTALIQQLALPCPAPFVLENFLEKWNDLISSDQRISCHHEGCIFTAASVEDMENHCPLCTKAPKDHFKCKLCTEDLVYNNKEIIPHFVEIHRDKAMKVGLSTKPPYLSKNKRAKVVIPALEAPALPFRNETLRKKYNSVDIKVNVGSWLPCEEPKSNTYLPTRKQSIPFVISEVDDTGWQSLKFPDSLLAGDNVFFYCGDPISVCAWCPQFGSFSEEYIAVSTCSSLDADVPHKSYIQIWGISELSSGEGLSNPKLQLTIGFDMGPVTDMHWFPGEISDPNCLGILAAVGSCSHVSVWLVPKPDKLDHQVGSIYIKSPDFKLIPCTSFIEDDNNDVPLRFEWVIDDQSIKLSCTTKNGDFITWRLDEHFLSSSNFPGEIIPEEVLKLHRGPTSGLSFCPNPTVRCFSTGGHDRVHYLWDNTLLPEPLSYIRREIVKDSVWHLNSVASLVTFNDATLMGHASSTVRESDYYGSSLMYLKSEGMPLRFCSSQFSQSLGEVCDNGNFNFIHFQDLHKMCYEKGGRYSVYCYKAQWKQEKNSKNGIVFSEKPVVKKVSREAHEEKIQQDQVKLPKNPKIVDKNGVDVTIDFINHSSLVSASSASFSPNFMSRHWVVVGYRCGIARIIKTFGFDDVS